MTQWRTIAASGFPAVCPQRGRLWVGDVNGDGKADVIWHNSTNGSLALWLMSGGTVAVLGFPSGAATDWEIQP